MKKFLLKQKIALLLLVVGFISIIVSALAVYFSISKNLVESKRQEIFTTTIEQSREIYLLLNNYKTAAHILSDNTKIKEFLSKQTPQKAKELSGIFSGYIKDNNNYLSIYLIDKSGIGLVSTDSRFVGQNYSFRKYYQKALNKEDDVSFATGKTSNQLGFYFSEPVFDKNNNILGILIVKVDPREIDDSILRSALSNNNILMLTDEYGIVMSTNEKERKLKSLGPLTEQQKEEILKYQKYSDLDIKSLQYEIVSNYIYNYKNPVTLDLNDKEDGDNEIISLVQVGDMPFYLTVETRLNTITKQVLNIVYAVIFIIIAVLLIISLFVFHFLKIFLRPLDKFKAFFNSISNGNFSNELNIDTRDEFSEMAFRINKMAKDLSDLYNNLDSKVKEQTLKIKDKIKESEDQSKAMLNILEDVEKEKSKAENLANDLEKFKLAVDNASDQIVITDPSGVVIYGNKAVESITGYSPEEALGKKAGALWKLPMPADYYEKLWDVIKKQKKTFIGEIVNRRKSGEIYTATVSISSVLDKNGNILYFVAIQRDITKEKEIDKAKTEFVSLASHQLRTPLSAINWYTEMLLSGDAGSLNDEQKNYLEEVYSGNKRMVDLVNDLLNVSRLDLGTFKIEAKPINILELLDSVLDEMKPMITKKEIVLNKKTGRGIGEFIADEKLLRMVYQNIISNAIKYTPFRGEVGIKLEFKKKDSKVDNHILVEDSIIFTVSDSGMGIPENQKDKIFSKLFRADNAKESETEGTGLGLYVIKSILDKSGGNVWFKSKENNGSTFYISFPSTGMISKD